MIGGTINLKEFSVFLNEAPVTGKIHEENVGTNANAFDIFSGNKIVGNAQVVNAANINSLKNKMTGTVSNVTNPIVIPPIDQGLFVDDLPDNEQQYIASGDVEYYKSNYIGLNANGGMFTASGGGTLHILVDQFGGDLDIVIENNTKVIVNCEASNISFNGNPNLPIVLYAPNTFDFVALDLEINDLAISDTNVVIRRLKYSK